MNRGERFIKLMAKAMPNWRTRRGQLKAAATAGEGGGMTDEVPRLRSLSPSYVPDQHRDYVEILKAELTKSGADAPRNVALTGHYGSGKSSVLSELQRQLEKADVKVINLSLPSLGVGNGRIPKEGDPSLDKTNLIQKEIVKQLLYRRRPADTPASRYSRLDTFHWRPALARAVGVGLVVAAFALLMKLPIRLRDAVPQRSWTWLNDHTWNTAANVVQWLSIFAVFILAATVAVWVERLLQQHFRVTELAAGPTKVTLSESSSSYFDEYLDEIVYFFQTSKTSVVIFEDLDRFKDPHIFETLRELNLLLNNAEQTGNTPIRFVYAIRDSVFEQLDVDTDDTDTDDETRGLRADDDEVRRLMSTNRTKFFDLVVPMVPFISHRTSRDLIRQELEAIDESRRPSNKVIDIVAVYLTDMRLIKNICNEYELFHRRILTDDGLKELTPDRLFASIVYKNLYLADYEKIRDGGSRLDLLYRAYRDWVSYQTAATRATERSARARLRRIDAIGPRAAQLGARLQEVLLARHIQNVNTSYVQVAVAGTTYSWADIRSDSFWRSYLQDSGDLEVYYSPGYAATTLKFDKVQTLMGQVLSPEDWTDEAKAETNRELAVAVADLQTVAHASMTTALTESNKLFLYRGKELSVASVAKQLFDGDDDLVLELLKAGLIDENFTLYITQFPGQAISASAMNFIIKAVQPDVMDIEYHFGTGEHVDTDDIEAVLDAESGRLLGGQSIYNVELFDYLLAAEPDKLAEPIRRLATAATSDRTFIDAYLTSGKSADALVQRLSASWPGVFDYLLGQDTEAGSKNLVDAALSGVRSQLTYTLSIEQRSALAAALPHLCAITTKQTDERATEIAETIGNMGIQVKDIGVVAEPLRDELVKRSLYPVTLVNLRAILGDDAELALDNIKGAREADTYPHVLAHLGDYLTVIDEACVPSIIEPDRFVEILTDVGKADVDMLEDAARRASADCMLSDLNKVEAQLWPAIAGAHRINLTARNVAAYIAEHDVDADLANWLRTAGAITVEADDSTPLGSLALNLLNAVSLGDDTKLELVDSLGPDPGSIVAANLQKDAHTVLPALVNKGLVLDDADAFTSLGDDEWAIKEQLITVSKAFPTYMTEVSLSAEDLRQIASQPVPDVVKEALLTEIATFAPKLGPRGAKALAEWLVRTERTPAAEAIVTLATKGGPNSARSIVKLLGDQAATIDLELLKQALNELGEPFSQLTAPGRDRPKPGLIDGAAAVLQRLQRAGIVSKFEENTRRRVFEVSKRHS